MENLVVWGVVSAAAAWLIRQFARRGRLGPAKGGECSGGCSSCAFRTRGDCGTSGETKDVFSRRHPLDVIRGLAIVLGATLPESATAADTVETYDRGATNLELYLGMDGLGPSGAAPAANGDLVLGYGLTGGLSAYVATAIETGEDLGNRTHDARVGLIATPWDGETLDLDLLLELGGGGHGFSSLWIVPGVELNLDFTSSIGAFGPYVRASVPINGERHRNVDGSTTFRTDHALDLNPGLQWTPWDGHQFLIEYGVALRLGRVDEADTWEDGGAALGYNVALSEGFELITQGSLAPTGNRWDTGLLVGVIATIPEAR